MHKHARGQYVKLGIIAGLSFASMYGMMFAMVDRFADVYSNVNQVYMAGLMTAPMVLIEMLLMWAMLTDMRLNVLIIAASIMVMVGCFAAIRGQAGITDKQLLRSMIAHHSSTILMCRKATIQDADIKEMCNRIIAGQRQETDEMAAKLEELSR